MRAALLLASAPAAKAAPPWRRGAAPPPPLPPAVSLPRPAQQKWAGARPPPVIDRAFTATGVYSNSAMPGGTCHSYSNDPSCEDTYFTQDPDAQVLAWRTAARDKFAPQALVGTPAEWENSTQYQTGVGFFYTNNGLCLQEQGDYAFTGLFDWVVNSSYGYPVGTNGTNEVWLLDGIGATMNYSFRIVVDGTTPLQMTTTFDIPSGPFPHVVQQYSFATFRSGADRALVGSFNEAECKTPPVCGDPAGAAPAHVTVYNFHPAGVLDVRDHNVGDSTGDVFFMCEDYLSGQYNSSDSYNSVVTRWDVELLPVWSQYQNCRGYPPLCNGVPSKLVGHEAAIGLGYPRAGQCRVNSATGEWWSMPSIGMCEEGQRVGGESGCTWRATPLKTIDGDCLTNTHGFYAMCRQEGRAPWAEAAKKYLQAFDSDNVSDGGCPPVQ